MSCSWIPSLSTTVTAPIELLPEQRGKQGHVDPWCLTKEGGVRGWFMLHILLNRAQTALGGFGIKSVQWHTSFPVTDCSPHLPLPLPVNHWVSIRGRWKMTATGSQQCRQIAVRSPLAAGNSSYLIAVSICLGRHPKTSLPSSVPTPRLPFVASEPWTLRLTPL